MQEVKMYRALYEYKSPLPGYLSFRAGDQFTIISSVNKDWYSAQNGLGEIGNVPRNYVKSVQTNADEVLKFVDWSIEAIHLQATAEGSGQYSHEQRATLQKLVQHRKDIAKQLQSRPPMDRSRSDDVTCRQQSQSKQEDLSRRQSAKRHAPPPPSISKEPSSQEPNKSGLIAPSVSDVGAERQAQSTLPDVVLPSPFDSTASQQVNHTQTEADADRSHQPCSVSSSLNNVLSQPGNTSSQLAVENELPSPVANNNASSEPTTKAADVQELLKHLEVPDKIGPELLEEVRKSTGLSFEKSKVAVETVLGYVGFKMPPLEGLMDRMLRSLHFGRDISDEDVTSHDAQRLNVIFSEITACKDDSQQRSWALHEDEAIIQEYLQELLSILENAKPSICRKVVSRDNYEILHSLVQYYQMEMRTALSLLLLKVFGALCALEKEVITHLLYSVLPLELGQTLKLHADEVQRACYVTLLLTMIFSTGDDVSSAVTDQFNQEFFLHVLQLIENPPSLQFEDDAVDLLISFVLSFNLHLTSVDTNVVLSALAAFGTPKIFTEHIMVLINRGNDPVKMFDFKPQPPNSVLKLFHDLYADLTTADLLYTNDAKVLMDVIVGRLSNLSPGDKVRSSFLALCQKVVQNSSYSEHCHRARELQVCLETICSEEADTPGDKRIALEIMCKHPDIFPKE